MEEEVKQQSQQQQQQQQQQQTIPQFQHIPNKHDKKVQDRDPLKKLNIIYESPFEKKFIRDKKIDYGTFAMIYQIYKVEEKEVKDKYKTYYIAKQQSTPVKENLDSVLSFLSEREATLQYNMNHLNICKVFPDAYYWQEIKKNGKKVYKHASIQDHGGISLMQICRNQRKKGEKLPQINMLKWMYQCLVALEYMYKIKRIAHRNICPQNILMKDNLITLIGFSQSEQLEDKQGSTQLTTIRGFENYLAPELMEKFQDDPEATLEVNLEQCEIFSLGMVFFQLGLIRKSKNIRELNCLKNLDLIEVEVNTKLDVDNYREFMYFIKKMTYFDTTERFQSFKDIIREMDDLYLGKDLIKSDKNLQDYYTQTYVLIKQPTYEDLIQKDIEFKCREFKR